MKKLSVQKDSSLLLLERKYPAVPVKCVPAFSMHFNWLWSCSPWNTNRNMTHTKLSQETTQSAPHQQYSYFAATQHPLPTLAFFLHRGHRVDHVSHPQQATIMQLLRSQSSCYCNSSTSSLIAILWWGLKIEPLIALSVIVWNTSLLSLSTPNLPSMFARQLARAVKAPQVAALSRKSVFQFSTVQENTIRLIFVDREVTFHAVFCIV